MTDRSDVVIVGGGQAGLAVSHELTGAGVEHLVLEQGRVGQMWRGCWDSMRLTTPNWNVSLPGQAYDQDDPDGFMHRDDVIAFLERYAAGFDAPVREGVAVTALRRGRGDGFVLDTEGGEIAARTVVVATGTYGRPSRPPGAVTLPDTLLQIDAADYRNSAQLPAGGVLVVGSGQSGCQIAEELRAAGREVFMACGRAPWLPRRIGGHDANWWGVETGFFDAPVSSLPSPAARLVANVQQSGTDGGHDLHYRTLLAMGVTLLGHFVDADARRVRCANDLAQTVAWADARHAQLMGLIGRLATQRGLPPPPHSEPPPVPGDAPEHVELGALAAVIFAGGLRPHYASWISIPDAFDDLGFPLQRDGASTAVAGLYFIGVHFMRKRKSALFIGACEDAPIVAGQVAARHAAAVG
jgi:putative flavoprotein involved in K+ transport